MATLHEAQEDYIKHWKKNAEQHFKDGDYDWIASLVEKSGAQRILEIGCGVGYSTLALANRGIQALSIDPIPEAIDETSKLLESFGISVGILGDGTKPGMLLKQADAIEDYSIVSEYTQWIDLILICNPGGKLESDLTENELEMLHWGKYSDDQMKEETVPSLHKWAVIIAAGRLAKENNKKLVIVDRGSIEELESVLDIIQISTGMRGIGRASREIKDAPEGGIQLDGRNAGQLFWGAGLYEPGI